MGFTRGFRVLQLPIKNINKRGRKMMFKKFRYLALTMVLILVVVSCTTFAAVKPVKLVFGSLFVPESFVSKGDLYFKELVEKNSKGQILIDFFPGSILGSETEMLQATRTGAQQLINTSAGECSTMWPQLATFGLWYLFRDEAHFLKVAQKINSLIDPDKFAAKTGMRILNVRTRSPRHLTTKFPVNKFEDIKGLKVRVPEDQTFLAFMRSWNTIPTVIPGSDTYTALATGTVDAQENPLDFIYTMKFYEQTKYCALTAHQWPNLFMTINDKCWNGLPKAQQKIIQDAANKNAKYSEALRKKEENEMRKLLVKNGMKFTTPALAPFRENATKVWGQIGDVELIKKIEAIK
jgi:tripartite ATP-independent transporter DctP family solute receptor